MSPSCVRTQWFVLSRGARIAGRLATPAATAAGGLGALIPIDPGIPADAGTTESTDTSRSQPFATEAATSAPTHVKIRRFIPLMERRA
jgi:hypothetical protein